MTVPAGTPLPLEIRITTMPEYDNDQYIGACLVNGMPHHITLFRVTGDDHEQEAVPGHAYRHDAVHSVVAIGVVDFLPLYVDDKAYLCVITPQSI